MRKESVIFAGPGGLHRPLPTVTTDVVAAFMSKHGHRTFDPERALRNIGVLSRETTYDFERCQTTGVSSVDMATESARAALAAGNIMAAEVGALCLSTGTPEALMPHDAGAVHKRLELRVNGVPAINSITGCAGAVCQMIQVYTALSGAIHTGGKLDTVLVTATSNPFAHIPGYSPSKPWYHPDNILLRLRLREFIRLCWPHFFMFGNGAASIIMRRAHIEHDEGILATYQGYDPRSTAISCAAGGTSVYEAKTPWYLMDLGAIERDAHEIVRHAVAGVFEQAKSRGHVLSLQDLDGVIVHQAAKRTLEQFLEDLKLSPDKVLRHAATKGNLATAGVPTLMHESWKEGKWKEGTLWLIVAPGQGWEYGAFLYRVPAGWGCDS